MSYCISPERLEKGPVAVFECCQSIPCNPCAEACPRGAIQPFADINDCPKLNDSLCNGCGLCLTRCPGLSIFVMDYSYSPGEALIKLPYEFFSLPVAGEIVEAINREGQPIGTATVVRTQQSQNKTSVIWVSVHRDLAMETRNIRRQGGISGE